MNHDTLHILEETQMASKVLLMTIMHLFPSLAKLEGLNVSA